MLTISLYQLIYIFPLDVRPTTADRRKAPFCMAPDSFNIHRPNLYIHSINMFISLNFLIIIKHFYHCRALLNNKRNVL